MVNIMKKKVERLFQGSTGLPQLIDKLADGDHGTEWREANELANQLYIVMLSMAKNHGGDD